MKEKEEKLRELTKNLSAKELEMEGKKQKVESNIELKYEIASKINEQDVNFENINKKSPNSQTRNKCYYFRIR